MLLNVKKNSEGTQFGKTEKLLPLRLHAFKQTTWKDNEPKTASTISMLIFCS